MNEQIIKQKCSQAAKIFYNESISGYPLYKYLPNWLSNKSLYLQRHRVSPKKYFKKFNRGSLVMVDFGINVGHEMSGNHFAIVLNKNDSPKNGVLTVIPVTSKPKQNLVQLDSLISEKSSSLLDAQIRPICVMIISLIEGRENQIQAREQTLESKFADILRNKLNITREEIDNKNKELGLDYFLESKLSFPQILNQLSNDDFVVTEEIADFINKATLIMNNNKIKRSQADIKLNKIFKVSSTYKKYSKISYAKPNDIQTVSKYRIKTINEYDPCGKIKVSNDVLDKIDNAIIRNITNTNIDN